MHCGKTYSCGENLTRGLFQWLPLASGGERREAAAEVFHFEFVASHEPEMLPQPPAATSKWEPLEQTQEFEW